MPPNLPEFVYHPDPIGSGVIEVSDKICVCCQQARGYIYTGPVYSTTDLHELLCPWCIADGSAHEKFGASFTDDVGIGGYREWEPVSQEIVEIVAYRTPGFCGWQQERWWTHCADAAIFVGVIGYAELQHFGEPAMTEIATAISKETALTGDALEKYLKALSKDGSPTAYLFKCRHCSKYGAYSDCD